ncbi:hypothetical protein RHGRI_009001 [Rhododendron griersonianum]|uniref:RNA methyltransferase n=1 Tax=Rhododendron griersonianum TaxID=479676 RepID=A0AAV6L402_9ERIC|nr:hypothetical protein RHGRI_009001 [Rhododendron griersonianum]
MGLDEKKKNNNNDGGEAETTTDQQSAKKRKRKEVAIFGNYRNYYGYRVGQELEEDPRLKVLKKEWFEGKDCLDIGCNNGTITITIAKKFGCRSILGVDIDGGKILKHNLSFFWGQLASFIHLLDSVKGKRPIYETIAFIKKSLSFRNAMTRRAIDTTDLHNHLDWRADRIEDAHWNLRKTVKMSTRAVQSKPTKLEDSERMNGVQHHVTEVQSGETRNGKDLSHIVTFQKGNFVKDWRPPEDSLSVAKWIHLNWGDDGLIILFAKIWKLLEPGGILILEPQPWNSYYKNRLVSEMAQTNYHNIKIYPEGFQEVLLDKKTSVPGYRAASLDLTGQFSLSGNDSFGVPLVSLDVEFLTLDKAFYRFDDENIKGGLEYISIFSGSPFLSNSICILGRMGKGNSSNNCIFRSGFWVFGGSAIM